MSGRLSEAKGQKEAIAALGLLKQKGKENIILHMAGAGNIEEYKKIAKQFGVEKQVEFYGHIDYLEELRKSMDIELVCSKKEAFGRVTVEAMAHGLGVIGANTGGTKEIIQSGKDGLLYHQGDVKDLAEKIELLIDNADYRKELALNAVKKVHSYFTVKINAENVYKYYIE